MTEAEALRAGLVAELTAGSWLVSQAWRDTFTTVPRHLFLRRFFVLSPDGSAYVAIDEQDPRWLELAYRNAVWPTQLDADPTAWGRAVDHGSITGTPTCSSTQPSLMAVMLESLDVHPGHRVLEIGTGTGYNAALLAHRLGGDHVVTVDVDDTLIAQARANLHRSGNTPAVTIADGLGGHRAAAPYDRIIATCSVTTIPPAWIEQVRPGGVVLTNIHRLLVGQNLLRLTVTGDGTAIGTLLDDTGDFMPLRAHQYPGLAAIIRRAVHEPGRPRPSGLPGPIADEGPAWTALADLLLPGVARTDITRPDGDVQWLAHPDGSWAYLDTTTNTVEQGGPARLWDQLEGVHHLWTSHGKPPRDRIGVTVDTAGNQHIWLHEPTNTINDAFTDPPGHSGRGHEE